MDKSKRKDAGYEDPAVKDERKQRRKIQKKNE